ncbi:uncharacterized protein LOC144095667 [Amblyomma americanum]
MVNECAALKAENKSLRAENAALTSDRNALQSQVSDCELRLNSLEQYSRNRNAEITGLPVTEKEILPEVIERIGEVLNVPVTSDDIEVCHRVPTKASSCQNIVLQFQKRSKRDAFLEKARKQRITTSDLGHPDEDANPVYINEHLCPSLKKLMGLTVSRKKDKQWKFAWTRNGRIFAKKDVASSVVRIDCVNDLEKIV